jgi:hypothetical protein
VISARSAYEDVFPGDCHRWKVETFKDLKKNLDENVILCVFESKLIFFPLPILKQIITNLICLGDSHIEMDAAHILAKSFNQALIKTIKFRENPKPDELVKQ